MSKTATKNQLAIVGEYAGKPVISLRKTEEDRFMPFSFGKTKAKLIVQHFEAIKKFAQDE